MSKSTNTAIVIPSWNAVDLLPRCIDSLLEHEPAAQIIVIDNGSHDGSVELLKQYEKKGIDVAYLPKNTGFSGGVNRGIERAIELNCKFVALFNNDAFITQPYLNHTLEVFDDRSVAVVGPKVISLDGTFDSTGDHYTSWGLPTPRGRGEKDRGQYEKTEAMLAISGGAAIYRIAALKDVGIFDEDFFAYYEDIDLSLRLNLAGWKAIYCPQAVVHHEISATSSKMPGFATYQTLKNLPWVVIKNMPFVPLVKVLPRFWLAYTAFVFKALLRGQFGPVFKGLFMSTVLMPKKIWQRWQIQSKRKISSKELWSMMYHDLPPNARALRKLRSYVFFWRKYE